MTEAGWTVCIECGMVCEAVEYHPYAACLMFKQCLNSETVRANLQDVRDDSFQQGRVACLGDVKRYVERQIKIGEDFIGGPDPNIQRRVALDEVIEYCDRQLAQQAQGGVGDGHSTKV